MKMPADVIREEIRKTGVISFARFMQLALYCPETGYYETKKDIVGGRGDFITSVSAGSLFGELLAWQFARWLGELPPAAGRPRIVEAGAHDGRLAADVLNWLQLNRRELFDRLEYVIVEPSPGRRSWQAETLARFAGRVAWVPGLSELKDRPPAPALIFSNELLDAFPVHRHGWDAAQQKWFEWGVALDGGQFCWRKIPDAAAGCREFCPPALERVLPDGYIIETCPAAELWWREAAAVLILGKLLAIDYGFAADEIFSPARTRGTLRAYHRHQVSDDLLAQPGGQDLTAHVNFAAIQAAGEAADLRTELFCPQPRFLIRILQQAVADNHFAQLDARQVRQFQTLTHPEHLGRAFRVLVQSRPVNHSSASLAGFNAPGARPWHR